MLRYYNLPEVAGGGDDRDDADAPTGGQPKRR